MNAEELKAEVLRLQSALDSAHERERQANTQRSNALEELRSVNPDKPAMTRELDIANATCKALKLSLDEASADHKVHQRLRERIIILAEKCKDGFISCNELKALLLPEPKESAADIVRRIGQKNRVSEDTFYIDNEDLNRLNTLLEPQSNEPV